MAVDTLEAGNSDWGLGNWDVVAEAQTSVVCEDTDNKNLTDILFLHFASFVKGLL